MTDQYRPRVVDEDLAGRLGSAGAVLIEGPRACGKTATGRRHAASEVLLDVDAGLRRAAELEPGLVLEGPAPRLLDEWQTVPSIWNHVRRAVDIGSGADRFILTGSVVPPDDTTRHTGAGRVSRLPMRPMSLFESGDSTGEMSLGAMLRAEPVAAQPSRTTVKAQPVAEDGDVVVARLEDEVTLKRYVRKEERRIEFHPESTNPDHQAIRIDLELDPFEVAGVAVGALIGDGFNRPGYEDWPA